MEAAPTYFVLGSRVREFDSLADAEEFFEANDEYLVLGRWGDSPGGRRGEIIRDRAREQRRLG